MLGALELGKDLVHAVNVNSRQLEHNADVLPLHPARLQILVFEANLVASLSCRPKIARRQVSRRSPYWIRSDTTRRHSRYSKSAHTILRRRNVGSIGRDCYWTCRCKHLACAATFCTWLICSFYSGEICVSFSLGSSYEC